MQFVVIGLDGTDEGAVQRRAKAREAHIDLGESLRLSGNMLYGAALLHDDGSMKGSMIVVQYPSEKELYEWLESEPYVVGNVWKDVTVHKSNTREPWQFNRPREWFKEHQS
ncbi:MAG: hypothetical protein JWO47_826 [Candidatus Saccharibacteria bacterium]|nr:hypothetical protein [Candidatus Saccharibacteria bacterium]